GDVVELEVEEEADAGRAHRRRKGVAHARRAVRQEELQPELDPSHGRPRPARDRADQPGGEWKIDRVDGAIDGIGTAGHGGAQPSANAPAIQRHHPVPNRPRRRTPPMPMPSASKGCESRNPEHPHPASNLFPRVTRASSWALHCTTPRQTPIMGNGLGYSREMRAPIAGPMAKVPLREERLSTGLLAIGPRASARSRARRMRAVQKT